MDADRALLAGLFAAAVASADPARVIAASLPPRPRGRTVVIGAGKAAARMAAALEAAWDGALTGVVVTRYGHGAPTGAIRVLEAGHPVPDEAGLAAASALVAAIAPLGPDDLVIALVSGGGSALLPAPPPGLTLFDEIAVNAALLASGAPIAEMNLARKHVSSIKGGRLALMTAAPVVTLIVSDVPGDQPFQVASGPTVPDSGDRAAALAVVARHRLALPEAVLAHLLSPAADAPRPSDPRFARNRVSVIASAGLALGAAAEAARRSGLAAVVLSDALEGEARRLGAAHAALALRVARGAAEWRPPVVLLSGGETTVTLAGPGRGGRNGEYALALGLGIAGAAGIVALAADTDGIDGSEDNAGAFVDGLSAARLRALGLDPAALLAANDSHAAFAALGDLLVTGPTGTNVNDFRAILVR